MGSGKSGRDLSGTTLSLVSLEKYHRPGGAVSSLSLPLDILNSVSYQPDWGVGKGSVQVSDREKRGLASQLPVTVAAQGPAHRLWRTLRIGPLLAFNLLQLRARGWFSISLRLALKGSRAVEFWSLEIVPRVTIWTLQSTWKQALGDLGPRQALTHILICF